MANDIPVEDRNTWLIAPIELGHLIPDYCETIRIDGYVFARSTDGRFMDDRCLTLLENYGLLLDGVILNKAELFRSTGTKTLSALILSLIREEGVSGALKALRGPFSGALLERDTRHLHLFGNQTGESAAFVYRGSAGLVASNSFNLIMRLVDSAGLSCTFDEHAALVMLTYGFMVDDHTFAEEVSRVGPGKVLTIDLDSGNESKTTYWQLGPNTAKQTGCFDDAVREVDRLFRASVGRCFDKDLEYGYSRHLVDLSGGMDARMVNIVARDLGYSPITNITYSESRSDEARYSMQLASYLGHDCLYHPMDGGHSVLSPEDNLRLNSGTAFYSGITGGKFVLQSLDFSEFGLEHTGQLGGAVIGTYAHSLDRRPPSPGAGAYSRINRYPASVEGLDEELFIMNTRGFRGSTSSHLLRSHFTVAVSPYSDVELLDFMFSLPVEWRMNHKMFVRWVEGYYPDALRVPTTRLLPFWSAPARNATLVLKKAVGAGSRMTQTWMNRHHIPGASALSPLAWSMNPLESWFVGNAELRALVGSYQEVSESLQLGDELRRSLRKSFSGAGSITDSMLAVTVVAMYSMYFCN